MQLGAMVERNVSAVYAGEAAKLSVDQKVHI